jgi:hypothetical protein
METTIEYLLTRCRKLPWRIQENPTGPPFIIDADGNTVTQLHGTVTYELDGKYSNKNREHAELICYAVNNLKK